MEIKHPLPFEERKAKSHFFHDPKQTFVHHLLHSFFSFSFSFTSLYLIHLIIMDAEQIRDGVKYMQQGDKAYVGSDACQSKH